MVGTPCSAQQETKFQNDFGFFAPWHCRLVMVKMLLVLGLEKDVCLWYEGQRQALSHAVRQLG